MPNIKSAKKKVRQIEKQTRLNKGIKTRLKNIKKAIIKEPEKGKAKKLLDKAYSLFDKAVSKGIIKKNNAARKKCTLFRIVGEK